MTAAEVFKALAAAIESLLFDLPFTVTPDGSDAKRSDDPGPRGPGEPFAVAGAWPSHLGPGSLLRSATAGMTAVVGKIGEWGRAVNRLANVWEIEGQSHDIRTGPGGS